MTKQEAIKEIHELVMLNENAIRNHPQELIDVYDNCKGMEYNHEKIKEYDVSVQRDVELYIDTSSFISAWYHLSGDKTRRDKMVHSCAIIISNLGIQSEVVLFDVIKNEKFWRKTMKRSGVAPRNYKKIIIICIVLVLGIFLILR